MGAAAARACTGTVAAAVHVASRGARSASRLCGDALAAGAHAVGRGTRRGTRACARAAALAARAVGDGGRYATSGVGSALSAGVRAAGRRGAAARVWLRETNAALVASVRATVRAVRAGLVDERGKAIAAAVLLLVGTLVAHVVARVERARVDGETVAAAPVMQPREQFVEAPPVASAPLAETPPVASTPLAVAASAPAGVRPAAAAPASWPASGVRVQINARPWARIRVDGVDVGPTPLSHVRLAPGRYEFEAAFPDGRRVQRSVEITPESRFVSMR
jgi:hypothetical protein